MRTSIVFSSHTVSPTVVRTKCRVAPNTSKHSNALVVTMIGFASSFLIMAVYLAQELPSVAIPSSLLIGFAPLIGLGVLLIIVALLISLLVCTVERTLTSEDDGIVPEPRLKSKWHRITYFPFELLQYCLSLKEHSPPVLQAPLASTN